MHKTLSKKSRTLNKILYILHLYTLLLHFIQLISLKFHGVFFCVKFYCFFAMHSFVFIKKIGISKINPSFFCVMLSQQNLILMIKKTIEISLRFVHFFLLFLSSNFKWSLFLQRKIKTVEYSLMLPVKHFE